MRSVLRKAGWALAAAGGFGMAAPAFGQEPIRILGPSGHVVQTSEAVALSVSQARQEEAQVELAFLAEPMLFSFGLAAHIEGDHLEVRGYVPNEIVRDRALRVAREHSLLSVTDKLKTQGNITGHGSVDRPENIQRAVHALLADAFPQLGPTIDVKCDSHGHVTLKGSAGSVDEKLAVSHKLRQVPGCSCVVNQLSVPSAVTETQAAEVKDDLMIPAAPPARTRPTAQKMEPAPKPIPARPFAAPAKQEIESPTLNMPRVYPVQQPKPMVTVPVMIDDPPTPVIKPEPHTPAPVPVYEKDHPYGGGFSNPSVPSLPPAPPRSVSLPQMDVPSLPPPVKSDPPKASVPNIEKDHPYGGGFTNPSVPSLPPVAPRSVSLPQNDVPMLPPPEPRKTTLPSIDKDRPYNSGLSVPDLPSLTPVKPQSAAPAVRLPEVVNTPSRPVPPSVTIVPAQPKAPAPVVLEPKIITPTSFQPKVSATDSQRHGGNEESYVTEGTISFADDPPPPPKPAWSPPKPITTPMKPADGTLTLTPPPLPPSRSTSAPVIISAPPARVPAPAIAPPAPRSAITPATRLKERVQVVCGPAYQVKVTAKGQKHLDLIVSGARDNTDARRLMTQVMAIADSPEFRGVEINTNVE